MQPKENKPRVEEIIDIKVFKDIDVFIQEMWPNLYEK